MTCVVFHSLCGRSGVNEFVSWTHYACIKYRLLIPADKQPKRRSPGLVTWKLLQNKMAWSALFLLGGGFAIAKAGVYSGMNAWIGAALRQPMSQLPAMVASAIFATISSVFTEMTSNSATCAILAPIILSVVS